MAAKFPSLVIVAFTMSGMLGGCGSMRRADVESPRPSARDMQQGQSDRGELTIVRTARLDVSVPKLGPARTRAVVIAQSLSGWVEQEGVRDKSATMRLRVPEAQLDAALDSLSRLGRVRHRSSTAEDRTAHVVDLDARVTNLKASRDRLRALFDRATTVADVVAVERELARVQGDLDSLEAQLKLLRSAAAMSVLELSLNQEPVLGPLGHLASGVAWLVTKLFVIR